MRFVILAAFAAAQLIKATSPSSAGQPGSHLDCPAGSQRVYVAEVGPLASRAYPPVAEEFCATACGDGSTIKNGPYVLWGPNGERYEAGECVAGKREGKWTYWFPNEIVEQLWNDGRPVKGSWKSLGRPAKYVLDCANCIPQELEVDGDSGAVGIRVQGTAGRFCKLAYQAYSNLDDGPIQTCLVPKDVGQMPLDRTDAGLDVGRLRRYSIKTEEASHPFGVGRWWTPEELEDEPPPLYGQPVVDGLPEVLTRVTPDYPRGIHRGDESIILAALVGKDSLVDSVWVVTPAGPAHSAEFEQSTVAALRQYVFRPATRTGRPVMYWTAIKFRYDPVRGAREEGQ